ncbi:DUF4900 domain-containing protein [Deinococcus cellulosilyticus]|uniref:DUF4900 domain-containing protein n=1 Tax=Deinococcus cellulosilyticus (strain DSM 18568 / NBRC 106333 / KACC 11606 / 5516J-15) TaxID=1223518 RepID=A0A511N9U6_DEIC1|nr:DUF4900 domain-containing protein [Deinococcus cellulosilyticus]GEM49603.1 DUF4900 domain-containing protein [Deinococcus cellulosilyticus NBRC 106333 = KACC 11606]
MNSSRFLKQQGFALLSVILLMVLVLSFISLLATRSVQQIQASGDSVGLTAATLASYSGQNVVTAALQGPIRGDLTQTVMQTSRATSRWSYGSGTGVVPDPASVDSDLAVVEGVLQQSADRMFCNSPVNLSDQGSATVRVYFTGTACGTALPAGTSLPPSRYVDGAPRSGAGTVASQTYGVPYLVVVTGTKGKSQRMTTLLGEYQFQLGRSSFARYGLFTNIHTSKAGSNVVFTSNILYDGPVHTNGKFNFSTGTPYFGSYVTSVGCNDVTCTSKTPSVLVASGTSTITQSASTATTAFAGGANSPNCVQRSVCPELVKGIDFNASYIPMPTNSQNQQAAAQAAGLVFTESMTLRMWAADANGNVPAAGTPATAQYIQACRTANTASCQTWRITMVNGQMVRQLNVSTTATWSTTSTAWAAPSAFNGVIYAPGFSRVGGLDRTGTGPATAPAALASFAQITVAAEGNIRITRDLKYENTPCPGALSRSGTGQIQTANCSNMDAQNILGIYSQSGDVTVGSNSNCLSSPTTCTTTQRLDHAPSDLTVQGVLMSSTGEFAVESYGSGTDRGAINLLGGLIENYYGPVGTTGGTGYKRAFTYDQRLLQGMSPPFFPTTPNDEVTAVFTRGYGIKEQ